MPADFGLVTLAYSLVTAVDAMAMPDAEDAVVRAEAPSPIMYQPAYTMSLVRGFATAIVISWAGAPVAVLRRAAAGAGTVGVGVGGCATGRLQRRADDFRRDLAFSKEFVLQLLPRLLASGHPDGGAGVAQLLGVGYGHPGRKGGAAGFELRDAPVPATAGTERLGGI